MKEALYGHPKLVQPVQEFLPFKVDPSLTDIRMQMSVRESQMADLKEDIKCSDSHVHQIQCIEAAWEEFPWNCKGDVKRQVALL